MMIEAYTSFNSADCIYTIHAEFPDADGRRYGSIEGVNAFRVRVTDFLAGLNIDNVDTEVEYKGHGKVKIRVFTEKIEGLNLVSDALRKAGIIDNKHLAFRV